MYSKVSMEHDRTHTFFTSFVLESVNVNRSLLCRGLETSEAYFEEYCEEKLTPTVF